MIEKAIMQKSRSGRGSLPFNVIPGRTLFFQVHFPIPVFSFPYVDIKEGGGFMVHLPLSSDSSLFL